MIDPRIIKNAAKESTAENKFKTECEMLYDTLNLLYKSITVCENHELTDYYYANASTLWDSIEDQLRKLAHETEDSES